MSRFKKGSAEAKAYMAKIRRMRKGGRLRKAYKGVKRHISGVRHMAKRRSYRRYFSRPRRRRSGGMTIPIAPILGLAAGLAESGQAAMRGDYAGAVNLAVHHYTGWSVERSIWEPAGMVKGVLPLVVGLLVHKFVGGKPLNLNATLAKAKVPFIRI